MKKNSISIPERISSLKRIIKHKNYARILEAHSGLSAMIAESSKIIKNRIDIEFDGIWESSLTDSATKGMPDASIIGTESRLHTINEIAHVTNKPIIVDGDTGGSIPQFEFLISNLERLGVSSVIIEDKILIHFSKNHNLHKYSNDIYLINLNKKMDKINFNLKNDNIFIEGFSWQTMCLFENYFPLKIGL